jgi:uncharacterized membrane protein SpoIIM required for sporulation
MTDHLLKSYAFRREREKTWRELETLINRSDSKGIDRLDSQELLRLPTLYRATLSSLSVARSISLDQNVVRYLESLAARAYFCVYGARDSFVLSVIRFFAHDFPEAVRGARWHILVAAGFLLLGFIAGYRLTLNNQEWFYTLVSDAYAEGRSPMSTPRELEAVIYETANGIMDALHVFASFLFTHNATIGILCFALGIAYGVPVVVMMFTNGTIIGAFAALHVSKGLSADFWAWITIHGTTEIAALLLCAGAGLVLGGSMAFPGPFSRLNCLALNGRLAARIAVGAVAMFMVAGVLEGFGRQLVTSMELRYTIGGVALVFWLLYFTLAGRGLFRGRNH